MIQAKDLRIGNWVTVVGIYKDSIRRAGIVQVDAELILLVEQSKILLVPINITKVLLEVCGWIWNKECKSYEKYPNGDARMHLQERGNGSYTMFNYVLRAMIAERIFFIHELQNLYYALTKTELETKL